MCTLRILEYPVLEYLLNLVRKTAVIATAVGTQVPPCLDGRRRVYTRVLPTKFSMAVHSRYMYNFPLSCAQRHKATGPQQRNF
jgi:hypothetical protein